VSEEATPPLPVAVDAMGGDSAPEAIVAGAVAAAKKGLRVLLVGDERRIRPLLPSRIEIEVVHTEDAVGMDESPTVVRHRDEASVRRCLKLVKEGRACAASGNSGALVVAAVLDIGMSRGMERPAIASVLPRADGGRLVFLDVGATVDTRPEQLARFALLGSAYARTLGIEEPRVGLLSNGEEPGKGNDQVRVARPLIEALPLRFVGNVEPSGALSGVCDVLVCDGFVGNVMLKAVEAAAETMMHLFREEIRRDPTALLGAWLLSRGLRRLRDRVAWDAHGGGMLLGTREVVVVGHGRSTPAAACAAIALAAEAAREGLVSRVEAGLARNTSG